MSNCHTSCIFSKKKLADGEVEQPLVHDDPLNEILDPTKASDVDMLIGVIPEILRGEGVQATRITLIKNAIKLLTWKLFAVDVVAAHEILHALEGVRICWTCVSQATVKHGCDGSLAGKLKGLCKCMLAQQEVGLIR